MNAIQSLSAAVLIALLPLAAPSVQAAPPSVRSEIRADMDDARREVRTEMAKARAELETGNLSLGDGLHFGKGDKRKDGADPAKAEISPKGDFLIDGKPVPVDARQRQQLLAYRGQVIDIARIGIEAGERAAMAALDATDVSLFSLIMGGFSGSLERRIERTVKTHIEPMVRQICRRLPDVLASQQQLAASLPQFRPYADLESDDVQDCEREMRQELAVR